ncbi:tripeptidyl peptidase-like protein [Venturia nashicola]|uniref:Tripeptidyl peptidase-like protein n=1 Tax=Venturia nashicola TaxID=86259 RepID=A0A4Z1PM44_9PEZI|nr:tripeptidyl peptidase-like protein [Venturia nashicola]
MLPSFGLIVTTLTLVCGVFTSPTAQSAKRYALKSTHHVPQKWERVAPAPPNHMISLQIGLRQGKADEVLQNLKEGGKQRPEDRTIYAPYLSVCLMFQAFQNSGGLAFKSSEAPQAQS